MSDIALVTTAAAERRQPPIATTGALAWVRQNLFSSWINTAVSLAVGYLIIRWTIGFIDWALINAIWSVPVVNGQAQTQACREIKGLGACWAVITEKHRFILFGTYPFEEHWRPAVVCLLFVGLYIVSAMRRFWTWRLLPIWGVTLTAIGVLMWGGDGSLGWLVDGWFGRAVSALLLAILVGVALGRLHPALLTPHAMLALVMLGGQAGLAFVPQERWGGLPITLILSTFGLAFAFPLAILVALGRRSRLPAIKTLCVLYVELIRGVPLISLLFMASVMFPLFLPEGMNIDKLLRAQVAIILFAGAYLAEVVRAGLQTLPRGQYEAAEALGLSYWQKTGFVILPQALRLVIPPLVNTFIGFFKDTSLVLIIGIFDLLTAGKTAIVEPAWQGFGIEVYITIGLIYLCFCFAMSKYSQDLERELNRHRRR
jgi:general L-amino acid transport system permease protein